MSYALDLAKEVVLKCTERMRQGRTPGIACVVSEDPTSKAPRLLLAHVGITPVEAVAIAKEMTKQLEAAAKVWVEAQPEPPKN